MSPDERALHITLALDTLQSKARSLWLFAEHLTPEQVVMIKRVEGELVDVRERHYRVRDAYGQAAE